ncbi:hypothetical protein [Psychrobacillus sp. L3]|uniref:hypothetical protein n=1 Tax=Psychrobacillus sp. L3 TaxID=3236891 RepID=UPI0036F2CFFC
MEWRIKAEKLNQNDTTLVSLIQLLCSLEFAISSAKWYVGEQANRTELPPHEHILALAINIASIGETLHKFEYFVGKNIITYSDTWEDYVKQSWHYLESTEVTELKKTNLKYVRDKSAFHIDPEPVKQFIDSLEAEDEINVWETNNGDGGHSPLAAHIIANTLISIQMDYHETARNTSRVYKALRDVVSVCLIERLK